MSMLDNLRLGSGMKKKIVIGLWKNVVDRERRR
jgi:hypothetical protein